MIDSASPWTLTSAFVSSKEFSGRSVQCGPPMMTLMFGSRDLTRRAASTAWCLCWENWLVMPTTSGAANFYDWYHDSISFDAAR